MRTAGKRWIAECMHACAHACAHLAHRPGVEAVVDEVLEVLAHADLPHKLVLVAVHACTHTGVVQSLRDCSISLPKNSCNKSLIVVSKGTYGTFLHVHAAMKQHRDHISEGNPTARVRMVLYIEISRRRLAHAGGVRE